MDTLDKFGGRNEPVFKRQATRGGGVRRAASYLRGLLYNRDKRQDGGHGNQKSGDQNDTPKTAERLASEHGVSAPTIKRDSRDPAVHAQRRDTTSMSIGC